MVGMTPARTPTDALDDLIAALRRSRFHTGIRCPRCGGLRTHRWGTFRSRQRYRCASCRRTFSDLTCSPAAYIKKIQLWPDYAAMLASGASLRAAASALGIHISTAFRWRHALLRSLDSLDGEMLCGWVEIASWRVALSEKGSRTLRRPARRRGYRPGSHGDPRQVHVLAACDRVGHCLSLRAGPSPWPPGREAFRQWLGNRVSVPPVIIEARGRFCAGGRFARSQGGTFRDARPAPDRQLRSLVSTDFARDYLARLGSWLQRFRGVSTRYLPNYLIWHRTVDREARRGIGQEALRWPAHASLQ